MDATESAMLMRRGNELFNNKDYKNALKIYLAIDYKDGIARIAGVMEHDKKDRVTALKLYKKAGLQSKVEKLAYDMAQAVRFLIKEHKQILASQKGENFDYGSRVSGVAPEMYPHEALIRAKARLGIGEGENVFLDKKKEIIPWYPVIISRKELDDYK